MQTLKICARYSVAIVPLLSGCAAVRPKADYQRATQNIVEATGVSATTQPHSADQAAIDPDSMLKDGLSVEEAVQFCLLNNPRLLSAFYDIGVARADLVQSTLFSNPTLAMSIAFPEGGGLSNIQATFAQNIVDLWQIPFRRRAADRALDAEILLVAQRAVDLANETRVAYFTTEAADETVAIADQNLSLANQLLEVARARQAAGAVGELDVNLARGTVYSAELEVQRAQLGARTERRRLATALGLTSSIDDVALSTPLATDRTIARSPEEVAEIAMANRPDIRAARERVERSIVQVRLEYLKIFPDFSIGFYDERNEARSLPGRRIPSNTARASVAAGQLTAPEIQSRGQRQQERSQEISNIFGPAFNLTLPIFDQNQAQIAKAKLLYEQSAAELDAIERVASQQVRQAVDQSATTQKIASYFRDKLIPQANKSLDLSRRSYEVGRASIIVLLDAQRILLATRRESVIADRDHSIAIAELERVTARPYSALAQGTTQQPAARTLEDAADDPRSIAVNGANQ